MTTENRVIVGVLSGAFGVKGEVRLKSFCAQPEAIADYTPLFTQDGRVFATVVITGNAPNALVVRMDGVTTKEEADALRGTELFVDRAQMPNLPDDEFYHTDLIGLEVYDTGGKLLGRVKAVLNAGASDLLELHQSGSSTTVLLPFTNAIVPTVDLTAGRIIADPPEGLLSDA